MPRKPSAPIFLNSSLAGNISAASHASTCGLISLSMKRLRLRCNSWCSWVNCMMFRSGEPDCRIKVTLRSRDRELDGMQRAASSVVADAQHAGQHLARVTRIDHAVVQQPARYGEGIGLPLEGVDHPGTHRLDGGAIHGLRLALHAGRH